MQAGRLSTWRSAIEHPESIVLLLCVVVAAALIGLELWPAISTQFDTAESNQPRAASAAPHSAANIAQITAADLFGHAASDNANLPQTNLQVTLRGVFAASDPNMASAVIETSDGHAQIVKVGGAVGASATLRAVYPNRVVLSRNGVLETLYFPAPGSSAASVAQNTPQTTLNPAAVNLPPGASPDEIKRAAILRRLEELRARSSR